jgi:hypothetical protein
MAGLHRAFVERLSDFRSESATLGKAEVGDVQRVWTVPSDWIGDPFLIPQQHLPSFDRTDINEDYESVHTGRGKLGQAASLQYQLATVQVMERAFRSRHASHLRCVMHAAARHRGHGHPQGFFGAARNYAQDLLDAAGA